GKTIINNQPVALGSQVPRWTARPLRGKQWSRMPVSAGTTFTRRPSVLDDVTTMWRDRRGELLLEPQL
ncbi:unnamed protein product, partial [Staurois parvus]